MMTLCALHRKVRMRTCPVAWLLAPLYDVYLDREQGYDICDIRGKMCF